MLTVKGHFVDDIRKVALKFNISTHFIQMFTFEKSSVRCVVRPFFHGYKVTKFRLASRSVCETQLCSCDAFVRILYHFVLMMLVQCLALWVETTFRYIKYIERFFLYITCRVQILFLPAMEPVARKLLLVCKKFCSMKRAHQGRILWYGHDISSTNPI